MNLNTILNQIQNVICENNKLTIMFIFMMIFYVIIGTDQPKKMGENKILTDSSQAGHASSSPS